MTDSPSETTLINLRSDDHFEAPVFVPTIENSGSSPQGPIGGHLANFSYIWYDNHRCLGHSDGLTRSHIGIHCSMSTDPAKRALMEAKIQHLLAIWAIEPVLPEHQGASFYSVLLLVQKEIGGQQSHIRFKASESPYMIQVLQNAHPAFYSGQHQTQRLFGFNRSL